MTPRQADKLIKQGAPVVVKSKGFNETFMLIPVSRTRWSIYGKYKALQAEGWIDNGAFDRADLEIVNNACPAT